MSNLQLQKKNWAENLYLEGTLSLDSDKEAALLAVLIGGIDRQVGAAHHSELDLAVNNQGQAYSKLLSSQESLCSINRV